MEYDDEIQKQPLQKTITWSNEHKTHKGYNTFFFKITFISQRISRALFNFSHMHGTYFHQKMRDFLLFLLVVMRKNLNVPRPLKLEPLVFYRQLPSIVSIFYQFLEIEFSHVDIIRAHLSTCTQCMSVLRIVLTYLKKFTLRPPVIPGSTLRVRSSKKGSFPRQV